METFSTFLLLHRRLLLFRLPHLHWIFSIFFIELPFMIWNLCSIQKRCNALLSMFPVSVLGARHEGKCWNTEQPRFRFLYVSFCILNKSNDFRRSYSSCTGKVRKRKITINSAARLLMAITNGNHGSCSAVSTHKIFPTGPREQWQTTFSKTYFPKREIICSFVPSLPRHLTWISPDSSVFGNEIYKRQSWGYHCCGKWRRLEGSWNERNAAGVCGCGWVERRRILYSSWPWGYTLYAGRAECVAHLLFNAIWSVSHCCIHTLFMRDAMHQIDLGVIIRLIMAILRKYW